MVLYAHYDVQPAPPEQGWTSDPWTPTRKDDGRIYGRGAADDISGLVSHLGTLRVFDGKPPCTVKLILEGMEETESNLEAFVEAHPELFACDVFVICDMGNLRVGEPALTTALRGDVACVVTVRTLEHPLHSGVFGGPAPDAMMALARLLSTLHDDEGNVAVEGVSETVWEGADLSEDDLRSSADVLDGVALTGSGPVGARLWAKPSINAIGVDMTNIATSSNVLIPEASAKISMRIVPGSEPEKELDALVAHLESHAPWECQGGGATHEGGSAVPLQDRWTGVCRRARSALRSLRQTGRRSRLRGVDPAVAHARDRPRPERSSSCGARRTSPCPASTRPTRASTSEEVSGSSSPRHSCSSDSRTAAPPPDPTPPRRRRRREPHRRETRCPTTPPPSSPPTSPP